MSFSSKVRGKFITDYSISHIIKLLTIWLFISTTNPNAGESFKFRPINKFFKKSIRLKSNFLSFFPNISISRCVLYFWKYVPCTHGSVLEDAPLKVNPVKFHVCILLPKLYFLTDLITQKRKPQVQYYCYKILSYRRFLPRRLLQKNTW